MEEKKLMVPCKDLNKLIKEWQEAKAKKPFKKQQPQAQPLSDQDLHRGWNDRNFLKTMGVLNEA